MLEQADELMNAVSVFQLDNPNKRAFDSPMRSVSKAPAPIQLVDKLVAIA
jgi:hypothetical protein